MSLESLSSIRYYKDNDPRNAPFPTKESYSKWFDFSIYAKIKYMAIYALPGTRFYLNFRDEYTDDDDKHYGYVVGDTGLYTIDVRDSDTFKISAFRVNEQSLEIIENHPMGHLVVVIGHEYNDSLQKKN